MSERELTDTIDAALAGKGPQQGWFLGLQICVRGKSDRVSPSCSGRSEVKPSIFSQRLPGQPPIAVKGVVGEEADELEESTMSGGESDAEGEEE